MEVAETPYVTGGSQITQGGESAKVVQFTGTISPSELATLYAVARSQQIITLAGNLLVYAYGYSTGSVFAAIEDISLVEEAGVTGGGGAGKYTYMFRLKAIGDTTNFNRASVVGSVIYQPFTFALNAKPVLTLPPGVNTCTQAVAAQTRTGGPPGINAQGPNIAIPYVANFAGWGVSYTGVTDATIIGNVGGVTTGYESIGQGMELFLTNGLIKVRGRFYQSVRQGNMDFLIWVSGTGWVKVGEIDFLFNGSSNAGAPNAYARQYMSGYVLTLQRMVNTPQSPLSEVGSIAASWQVLPNGLRIGGVITMRRGQFIVGFDLKNLSTTVSLTFGAVLEQPQYSFTYVTRGNIGTLGASVMNDSTPIAAFYYQTGPSWTNDTTVAQSGGTAYTLLSATTDYFYIGSALPFSTATITLPTPAVGGAFVFQYSQGNGNWNTLPLLYSAAGFAYSPTNLVFQPPNDWHPDTENGFTYYWIRLSTTSAPSTVPKATTIVINQLTELMAPSAVLQYTSGAYVDDTAANQMAVVFQQFFAILSTSSDYFYVGLPVPFNGMWASFQTAGSYGTLTWQYSQGSGSWGSLSVSGAASSLSANGQVSWTPPGSWATDTVGNYTGLYWIRVSAASVTTTAKAEMFPYVNSYSSTTSEDAAIDTGNVTYLATASSVASGTVVAGIICRDAGNGRRYEQTGQGGSTLSSLILCFDQPNMVQADMASNFEMVWFFALVYDGNSDNLPAQLGLEALADVTVHPDVVAVT